MFYLIGEISFYFYIYKNFFLINSLIFKLIIFVFLDLFKPEFLIKLSYKNIIKSKIKLTGS